MRLTLKDLISIFLTVLIEVNVLMPQAVFAQSSSVSAQTTNALPTTNGFSFTMPFNIFSTPQPDFQYQSQYSASTHVRPVVEKLKNTLYKSNQDVSVTIANPQNDGLHVRLLDVANQPANVSVSQSTTNGYSSYSFAPTSQFRPGSYRLIVTDDQGESTEQDFEWGVLAMNYDRSIYLPGQTADISMAVLDDEGNIVCGAALDLKITNTTLNLAQNLSTANGKIQVNPQCYSHYFSLQPDYETHITFEQPGTYNLTLTANTGSGINTISDTLTVQNSVAFDVQRISATRIYPPNSYPVLLKVTANQNFNGTITETVPYSFTIMPSTTGTSYTNMQTLYLNEQDDPAYALEQNLAGTNSAQLQSGQSSGFVLPFVGDYSITQGFGSAETDPTLLNFYHQFGLAGHDGVDFGVPMGTPVRAIDGGTVLLAGPGDYGITIEIQHSWGISYYGHLSIVSVHPGEIVTKGELIGYSGESGDATGPHLHLGMEPNTPDRNNGYYGKIDPLPFFDISDSATSADGSELIASNPTPQVTVLGASTSAKLTTISPQPDLVATNSAVLSASTSAMDTDSTASTSAELSQTATSFTNQLKLQALANPTTTNDNTVKVISWHVSLTKGQQISLGYTFKVPQVSPQFYLIGPLRFYQDTQKGSGSPVFQEARQWQLAADEVGDPWYNNGTPFGGYYWQYRKQITFQNSQASSTPTAPGITFMESGSSATSDLSFWDTANSFGTSLTATAHTENGPRSIELEGGATDNAQVIFAPTGSINSKAGRVSIYEYLNTIPNDGAFDHLMSFYTGTTYSTSPIELDSANDEIYCPDGATHGTHVLTTGTWYRLSVGYVISGANITYKIYLNGNLEVNCGTQPLADNAPDTLGLGADVKNWIAYVDDVYADSGADESDPGNIEVTAKLPINTNGNYATVGTPSGDTPCTTGSDCEYVNERPLDTGAYLDTATNTNSEDFGIQSAAAGDQDIANDTIVADDAWVYANVGTACTGHIVNNGTDTSIALTGTDTLFTQPQNLAFYPSSNEAIGIESCNTSTLKMYEAGVLMAFIPTAPASLTDYPALVDISNDADLKAHAQSNGNDILFADTNGNLLNYEIESYSAGNLVAWVEIPSLSTTANTLIYMYFGNGSVATSAQAPDSLWNNYNAVLHMSQAPPGTATDSTGNGNNGTISGTITQITGEFGNGLGFDGSSGYLNLGNTGTINPSGTNIWSIQMWYKSTNRGADQALFFNGTTGTKGYQVNINEAPCGTSAPYEYKVSKLGSADGDICVGTVPNDSNWHMLDIEYSAGSTTAYVDGVLSTPINNTNTDNFIAPTTNAFVGSNGLGADFFPGDEQELRIINSNLSTGWIATEYNNESSPSTFYTVGSLETTEYAAPIKDLMRGGKWFFDSTVQPFTF